MEVAVSSLNPRPRTVIADPSELLRSALGQAGFAGRVDREMKSYPAALPWRSRPPTRGRRRGGRRTGDLGRGWRLFTKQTRQSWEFGTRNRVKYAVHVEGPVPGRPGRRQTAEMRRRNWPNVTGVARRNWVFYRYRVIRILQQRDPRLRVQARG